MPKAGITYSQRYAQYAARGFFASAEGTESAEHSSPMAAITAPDQTHVNALLKDSEQPSSAEVKLPTPKATPQPARPQRFQRKRRYPKPSEAKLRLLTLPSGELFQGEAADSSNERGQHGHEPSV